MRSRGGGRQAFLAGSGPKSRRKHYLLQLDFARKHTLKNRTSGTTGPSPFGICGGLFVWEARCIIGLKWGSPKIGDPNIVP